MYKIVKCPPPKRYRTIATHTLRRASVLVVFVVLRAHVQFCWFDKADATADIQWLCNHLPPLWYHYFPDQSSLGADILVYWIGKIVRTCAPGGSRTLDFLPARRAPYPLGQALHPVSVSRFSMNFSMDFKVGLNSPATHCSSVQNSMIKLNLNSTEIAPSKPFSVFSQC